MSERKTTEIKLRVTPAEKTAWQLAAEEEGIGLSELIRREMNEAATNYQVLRDLRAMSAELPRSPYAAVRIKNITDAQGVASPPESEDSSIAPTSWEPFAASKDYVYTVTAVPTSGEVDVVNALGSVIASEVDATVDPARPKPWTFEGRNSE